jgi:hypothetical protein
MVSAVEAESRVLRSLDENGSARDGKPIMAGDVFQTLSGRITTPYPKSKREAAANDWLIENAAAEARGRGDGFNAAVFGSEPRGKKSPLPPASVSSMLLYLFAWQPEVVPPLVAGIGCPLGWNGVEVIVK